MKMFSDFTHKISWSIFPHALNRCHSASGRCLFVLLTAHDHFFAVRNDTAPVIAAFEKPRGVPTPPGLTAGAVPTSQRNPPTNCYTQESYKLPSGRCAR